MRRFLLASAVLLALGGISQAALITFSGAYPNGQTTMTAAYQPLVTGYGSGDSYLGPGTGVPGSAADGGPLGITISWDGAAATSGNAFNGGVHDHTGDSAAMIGYDGGGGGSGVIDMKFSAPVSVPSLYYGYYGGGSTIDTFTGYLNGNQVASFTENYPGGNYSWTQATGFGSTPVDEIRVSAGNPGGYIALDDITVNKASAVPEPASLTLLGLGGLALVRVRRRRLA